MKLRRGPAQKVLAAAVAKKLEQAPPFDSDELASLGTLVLSDFDGTPDFSAFPGLWRLCLVRARELQCDRLPSTLEILVLSEADLTSIGWLKEFHLLEKLELSTSPIRDLTPLLALPKLRKLKLHDVPADTHSTEVVLPELEKRGVKIRWGNRFSEDGLELTWALNDAGLPLLCRSAGFLEAPGTGLDSLTGLTHAQVLALAQEPGITVEEIWRRHYKPIVFEPPPKDPNAFDWDAHKFFGDAAEARQWVAESPLPDDWKAHLRALIDRFPESTFERWDAAAVGREETICGSEFPQWLRDVIMTLDQLHRGYWLFEFDASVQSRGIYRGDNPWFHQRPARIGKASAKSCVDKGMLPFCDNTEQVLGVSLDGEDTGVYLFSIGKAMQGAGVSDGQRVFDSLPEMMAHVAEDG